MISLSVICAGLLTLSLVLMAQPAQASPAQQAYIQTPTPGADGRILYTVKAGDTCISVSLQMGITEDQLRLLNDLKGDCTLIEGKQILLGVVTATTPTVGPTPTPTPILPSPTPFNGNGKVCIYLYEDVNGNAMPEDEELYMADGAVSISDKMGKVSLTGKTTSDSKNPLCFTDIPEGDYTISVAVPEGYNPTTNMSYALSLKAGDTSTLDFGAQLSSRAVTPVPATEGGRSPILGILGGLLLVVGAGLGLYFRRITR